MKKKKLDDGFYKVESTILSGHFIVVEKWHGHWYFCGEARSYGSPGPAWKIISKLDLGEKP
jgi:hypothetical protein